MLTAEGLIGEIIKNTDFSLNNSKVLILGFGKCGTNIASRLFNLNCVLFEIAGYPYGFDKKLSEKYGISLITCSGLPGKTAPKAAGELIAKSIISYLKQKGLG